MYDPFELPVTLDGAEILVPAQLFQAGYLHRFEVEVAGRPVLFERDDSGAYRALVEPEGMSHFQARDIRLMEAIARTLEEL